MANQARNQLLSNSIRFHRRKSGLSQRELGQVVGYRDEQTVARHECFHATPPLEVAISYEIVFRIPISEMFAELHDELEVKVEESLVQLEEQLGRRSALDRNALATARKLMWLSGRKDSEYQHS